MNIHWKNTELFWKSLNHMEWMWFLLKIRKSFYVSGVFFFPNDNITQVDTQQYRNHNTMEKITCCSFLASETGFDSNLKFFFLFLFSLFVQKASANYWNKLFCDGFIIQISFLKSSLSNYPFFSRNEKNALEIQQNSVVLFISWCTVQAKKHHINKESIVVLLL